MPKLNIKIGSLEVFAETTKECPETVKGVLENLPIKGEAQRWGEEIYFFVPFDIAQTGKESQREECEPGEIAFWPAGPAIAIFFGKTPVSRGSKPRAYSPCNFFARLMNIDEKLKVALNSVEDGTEITINKAK